MAEEQKPVEIPKEKVAAPAAEPAVETKAEDAAPAAAEPGKETETAAETSAAAETPAAAEEVKEEVKPVEEGHLEHKGQGNNFPKNLIFSKKYFWFGSEPVDLKALPSFKADKVTEVAHHVTAWASETGKGLLFFSEKNEKTLPQGAIHLADASEPVTEGTNKFHITAKGHKHSFKAGSAAERDNWVAQIKLKIAEAKELVATIPETETYKKTKESLMPAKKEEPKKEEAKAAEPAAEEAAAPAAAEATAAEPAAAETVEEPKKEEEKKERRSASRKRASVFGGLFGKKEEKPKAAEPEAAAESSAAPAEAPAAEAATEAPAAKTTATEAAAAEEAKPEEKKEEPKKEEVKAKRQSIFGNLSFNKKKAAPAEAAPAEETPATTEPVSEAAPAIPPVETSEPLSAEVASPATVPTETVEATPATNGETKKEMKSEKRKSSMPFGFGKRTTSEEEVEKTKSSPFSKLRQTIKGKPKVEKAAEKTEEVPAVPAETSAEAAAETAPAATEEAAKTEEAIAVPAVEETPAPKPVESTPVVTAAA